MFSVSKGQYVFDSINFTTIGPGTQLIEIIETTRPWSIQVLEIDLDNPYLSIETVKANDRLEGLEKTSSMAQRKDSVGHKVIGAINGDFFYGTGTPVNSQIVNGELLRLPLSRSTVGFDTANLPVIQIPFFNGTMIASGVSNPINNVNASRSSNALVLYNSFMGSDTETNEYGSEIICSSLSEWIVNDTVYCKVDSVRANSGSTGIPDGKIVFSGHGTASDYLLANVGKGDTIKFVLNLGDEAHKLKNMIGGYPQIIKDGANFVDEGYAAEGGPSHTYERHPRTAVGYSADRKKLTLITVDGRQTSSIGMTLPELTDFMLLLNVYDAVNLDGGGSTTMVANNEVVNSPSDAGGERNVANALLVVSSAPLSDMQKIVIQPSSLNIRYGSSQQLVVHAFDQYDNLLEVDADQLNWELSGNIGEISQEHIFMANGSESEGYIKATYESFVDSIEVNVLPVTGLRLSPDQIMTDSIIPVIFIAYASNVNSTEYEIDPELLEWMVDDETVGSVSSLGIFNGKKTGLARVSCSLNEVEAFAEVSVEIYEETELLDNMEDAGSWDVTYTFLDEVQVSVSTENYIEGQGSLKLDYSFTYQGRIPYIEMNKVIPVKGIPDSIWVDAGFDTEQYRISHNLATNSSITNPTYSEITTHPYFNPVGAELKVIDLTDYPYVYQELKIEIWKNDDWIKGNSYSGTLYLDNLRVSYPGHSPIHRPVTSIHAGNFRMGEVFPNPVGDQLFVRLEESEVSEKLVLSLIDLCGRELQRQEHSGNHIGDSKLLEMSLTNVNSGIYLLRIVSKDKQQVVRLIVK